MTKIKYRCKFYRLDKNIIVKLNYALFFRRFCFCFQTKNELLVKKITICEKNRIILANFIFLFWGNQFSHFKGVIVIFKTCYHTRKMILRFKF